MSKRSRGGSAPGRALASGPPSHRRRRGAGLIIFTVLAVIAGLVVVAVRAEGRELSRTSSNDGGAWVVNRDRGAVAHKNRATGELSGFVRFEDRPVFDVYQADDVVVVHDPTTNELMEIDPRSVTDDLEPTQLPEFSSVAVVDGSIVISRADPLSVWRVEAETVATLANLDAVAPLFATNGPGALAIGPSGELVVVDKELNEARWIDQAGAVSAPISLVDAAAGEAVVDVTLVDASAVVLLANGDIMVVSATEVAQVIRWQEIAPNIAPLVVLQQPSAETSSAGLAPAAMVAGATAPGELVQVDLGESPTARVRGSLGGVNPLAPIVHNGCVYGVVVSPASFGVACAGFESQPLPGAGTQLRLRLVNGWVWVNDTEDGATYVSDELQLESLSDWSAIEEQVVEEDEEQIQDANDAIDDPDAILVEDPDADTEVRDSDAFDPGQANVPPVAVDDQTSTRAGQATVVDVLANDFDLNNDILVVTDVELLTGSARVSVTPAGDAVQVTPAPGLDTVLTFRYSISDGRSDPVSATVTVDVVDADSNQPPEAVTDVVATAPGNSTTIDVLGNDSDPDGDTLALAGIETETGTLRWDPTGQVTFTPDTTTQEGWLELPYVVADGRGGESEGLLRVEIRDRGANQEPDARNDQATTVAGRAVTINLLDNDSDPDGDPLIVGSRPRLLEPEDARVRTSVTVDGEFVFSADVPGVYLFSYTVNDVAQEGSESDTARIRIDVLPDDTNQPPVAVRDDVVIPVGETRTVYVLDNDGDPDGDVVSIVNWQASPGLLVAEFNDGTGHVGFQITATPGSRRDPDFSYSISDGINAPVAAPVVIAVVDQVSRNQPPFANDDVIEARAGAAITGIPVLANDFDPEGGALEVVRVDSTTGARAVIGSDRQSVDLEISDDVVSSFSIAYDISDDAGNRAAAVLRVQLIPADSPNRPPVARTDNARTGAGQPVFVDVLVNDSDPDNDAIALEGITTQPGNGSASVTVDGAVRYEPDVGFAGTDVLRYAIVDAVGDRAVGEVFVGVQGNDELNLGPIANDDSYVLAGRPTITPLRVLENDFDPEGDALRVIDVSSSSLGRVSIDAFGQVEFVPPARLAEPASARFTYVIADTAGNEAQATVTVELDAYEEAVLPPSLPTPEPTPTPAVDEPTPVPEPTVPEPTPEPEADVENAAPIAVNDTRGPVAAGTEVRVEVLENDSDPDGPASELQVVAVDSGATIDGTAVVITVGEENVSVGYTIEDALGATGQATVTVLVTENQAPEVEPLQVGTKFETSLALDLAGQATDADGDDLFFICCENIRGGVLSQVSTAANAFTLTFTPDDGFTGAAGFSYRVDDQRGQQTAGSVSITVDTPENQAPVTTPDTVQIPQGVDATVDLLRVSADPDGDAVTRTLQSEPGGSITVQIVGSDAVVSVDRATPIGPAGAFTYEISDGVLSAIGEVAIEIIEGANEPPTATSTALDLPANSGTTIDLNALVTETDPGDSVSFELDPTTFGSLSVSLLGSAVQITAPVDASGDQSQIAFTATDTRGAAASGSIDVSVVDPTVPGPSAVADAAVAERNSSVTIDVLANDSDPLGQGLQISITQASFGTATVVNDQVVFSPGDNVGQATVDYTIVDQANRDASATITIETFGAPDKPAPPDVEATSGQVNVTWATPGWNGQVGSYTITKIDNTDGGTETVDLVSQNSYAWTGLINGNDYQFTVTAINDYGVALSDPSQEVTPDQKPEAPAPPSVSFGDRELTVTWTEPTNNGSAITGYVLELSPDLVVQDFDKDTFSYTWEGLTNGEEYTFSVRAVNACCLGDFSQPSAPERPLAAPDAPTIGLAQRTGLSSSLTVGWTPEDNNGDPVSRFRVQISSDTTGWLPIDDPTAESFEWNSGLTDGDLVRFRVAAENRGGWGAWSNWSNELESCSAPDPVNNVVAVRGDRQVELTWSGPDDNGCGITNYTITSSAPVLVQNSPDDVNPNHSFTGLRNGDPYTFTIVATNEIGTSVASGSTSNQVTPAGEPLCAGSGVLSSSVTAPGSVNLNWANGFLNNGDQIIDYQIDSGTGFGSVGASAQNTVMGSLLEGTAYTFSVRAENTVGISPSCGTTSATTWARPAQVELTLAFDPVTDRITVSPTGGGTGANDPAATNVVELRRVGGSVIESRAGSGLPAQEIFNMTEEGVITARVESCNAVGCVERTDTIEIALIDPPDQIQPSQLQFNAVDFQILDATSGVGTMLYFQTWPPNDNGGVVTDFDWEARSSQFGVVWNGSGTVASSGPSGTTHAYNFFHGYSLHPNSRNGGQTITWEVRVRAVNEAGPGQWSAWKDHSPRPPAQTLEATKLFGFCAGALPSCVPVRVSIWGFQDFTAYTPTVSSATRSGSCGNPTVITGRDGGATVEVDCNFIGGSAAPNTFALQLGGSETFVN